MARDEAIRAAVGMIWHEFGADISPHEKPAMYLTIYGLLERAVEDGVRAELQRKSVYQLARRISLN